MFQAVSQDKAPHRGALSVKRILAAQAATDHPGGPGQSMPFCTVAVRFGTGMGSPAK